MTSCAGAKVERTTKESDVLVELDLDGTGVTDISTGVPFFDHMLTQLGKHGGFDLTSRTTGDLDVDATTPSRTPRSPSARRCARRSATRRASAASATRWSRWTRRWCRPSVDLSGRPYLVHGEPAMRRADRHLRHHADTPHLRVDLAPRRRSPARARASTAATPHHIVEAQFKAVARALRDAVALDPRVVGVP